MILDLYDVDWGNEYAWVPCITEKKVDDGYKYNFVANKNIGVAVVDKPEGTYHDALGRALLTKEEIDAQNQVIDPDVFQDPATGKYYLYWGNSYLWMAELADDMISLVLSNPSCNPSECLSAIVTHRNHLFPAACF